MSTTYSVLTSVLDPFSEVDKQNPIFCRYLSQSEEQVFDFFGHHSYIAIIVMKILIRYQKCTQYKINIMQNDNGVFS